MHGNLSARSVTTTLLAAMVMTATVATAATNASAGSEAAVLEPHEDTFYRAPAGFEAEAPGTVLRTRAVSVQSYGFPVPVEAHQFLVRSTDAKDQPVAVAGTLLVPPVPFSGPRPLLSYQPATDSLGDQCNPSYTLRTGTEKELGLMAPALQRGWAVVVTDYQGPANAFSAGRMAGHGVLDGIRAALALPGTGLSGPETPVGLWGYSGGGLASSWAAEFQPAYAPELNVVGLASGGTPADLEAAARNVDGGLASGLVLLAAVGLTRAYPELVPLLNDEGHRMIARISDMCVGEATTGFPFRRLNEFTHAPDPLATPVGAEVMGLHRLGRSAPGVPVFLYHSVFDELIPFPLAQQLQADWCQGGAQAQFYADVLSEHSSLALTGAPLALGYLESRFAGLPAASTCL
jgi:hypothetical protein